MTKKRKSRIFFWEGKLHRVLRINYPANLVEAWRYEDRRRVTLLYTDWRENAGKALRHTEAAKLIRLRPETLNSYIRDGLIKEPQRSYALDSGKDGWVRWWSEKDMLELHDFLMSRHMGAPRHDGQITPMQKLPSRAEILAAFNESQPVYIRTETGEMIPLFKPPKV